MAGDVRTPRAAMRGVLGYFTTHRTAANLVLALMVIAGLFAALNMRAQTLPDIVLDEVQVTVRWEGAGPEAIDRGIVAPLLPALREVDGVAETVATATDGSARIALEFEPGHDMAQATADVERAVDGVTDLPEDAERPEVTLRAWRDRVTDIVVTGPVGPDQLARFADDLVLRLFDAGVTRTEISGVAGPETRITVPTRALIRHDLTLAEIAAAVRAAAEARPAGTLEAADARVTTEGARGAPDRLAAIVLRSGEGGDILTLGDVARIEVAGVDREEAFFVDGDPAVTITVQRTAAGDAIAIQNTVEDVVAALRPDLPDGMSLDLVRTRADRINERLSILLDNALVGLGLVLALLFLFLNARTAFWVAAGIPVAMLGAVALMHAAGVSLNLVSLFGLIITLGIVVDDAIVVGEHADFRARQLGEAPALAAANAARRMALPVFTASVTTIIAFFALVGIGGRFGTLIIDIPVTVVAVLAASLVECFIILPNHMRHALAHSARAHWYDWPSRQVNRGLGWVRERGVRPLTHGVIAWRYPVIAGAVLLLASQIAMVVSQDVPWRFWNTPERGSVSVSFAMLDGAERDDTMAMLAEIERAVDAVGTTLAETHDTAFPIEHALGQVGGEAARGLSVAADKNRDLIGRVRIELISADARPYSSFDVIAALREEIAPDPLLEEISYLRWGGGPGGDGLSVDLSGATPERLKQAAEALKRAVSVYPEVASVSDTLPWDKAELTLEVTPQARSLGMSAEDIGAVLRDRLDGIEAASFAENARTAVLRVELPEAEKTADFLGRTLIRAPNGAFVPLGDLVRVAEEPGFSVIRRVNGAATVTVSGDLDQSDPTRAAAFRETLQTDILPRIAAEHGVTWELAGLAAQERDFLSDAAIAFALALIGIFLTLAWVFASWTRPLAIMAIIPFGLTGAIWGHHVWDVPLSMFSVVGLIGMTGILINDSIVLVTTVDDYAKRRGLFPAIVDAVCDRLRPVLLTTLTTVLGLTPLLYEGSQQAQFLKPTVITLVFGLGFGFVLVLVVVPALLAAGHDVSRAMRAARRARTGRRDGPPVQGTVWGALAATLAWGAATLGGPVAGSAPVLPGLGGAGIGGAAGAFVLGAAVICAVAYAVAATGLTRRRSPRYRSSRSGREA